MSVRDQMWEEIYDTDRLTRYFQKLSAKFNRYHSLNTFFMVLFVFLAALPLMVEPIPNVISAILFLLVGCMALIAIRWDFSGKATSARMAWESYAQMSVQLRKLWYEDATSSQVEALQQLKVSIANSTNIGVDRKINAQAEEESHNYLSKAFR